jgi:hypothetical protein
VGVEGSNPFCSTIFIFLVFFRFLSAVSHEATGAGFPRKAALLPTARGRD